VQCEWKNDYLLKSSRFKLFTKIVIIVEPFVESFRVEEHIKPWYWESKWWFRMWDRIIGTFSDYFSSDRSISCDVDKRLDVLFFWFEEIFTIISIFLYDRHVRSSNFDELCLSVMLLRLAISFVAFPLYNGTGYIIQRDRGGSYRGLNTLTHTHIHTWYYWFLTKIKLAVCNKYTGWSKFAATVISSDILHETEKPYRMECSNIK